MRRALQRRQSCVLARAMALGLEPRATNGHHPNAVRLSAGRRFDQHLTREVGNQTINSLVVARLALPKPPPTSNSHARPTAPNAQDFMAKDASESEDDVMHTSAVVPKRGVGTDGARGLFGTTVRHLASCNLLDLEVAVVQYELASAQPLPSCRSPKVEND